MHAKKQEYTPQNEEKCQPITTEAEMTQIIESISKNIEKSYNCVLWTQEATRKTKHLKQTHEIDF